MAEANAHHSVCHHLQVKILPDLQDALITRATGLATASNAKSLGSQPSDEEEREGKRGMCIGEELTCASLALVLSCSRP